MTEFTIANIGKEVQRIKFDIECGYINSAIERCNNLDELIYEIEEGIHSLKID